MPRWLFILAIAGLTWVALTLHERGVDRAVRNEIRNAEIPEWETAAERQATAPQATDRPEDAFQRAWNKSERRVKSAMAREGGAR